MPKSRQAHQKEPKPKSSPRESLSPLSVTFSGTVAESLARMLKSFSNFFGKFCKLLEEVCEFLISELRRIRKTRGKEQ